MSLKVVVSVSRDRAEFIGVNERYLQLGVISVQMIFEGIFLDYRAKRSQGSN